MRKQPGPILTLPSGKRYACGKGGFVDTLFTPGGTADGHYVRLASGVRFHRRDGSPFLFCKAERSRVSGHVLGGFFVTCSQTPEGVRYMYGLCAGDAAEAGIPEGCSAADALARELFRVCGLV